jgi:hypothetical protein
MKGEMHMEQARWSRAFRLAAMVSMSSVAVVAQSGDLAAIQQKLHAQFQLTTVPPVDTVMQTVAPQDQGDQAGQAPSSQDAAPTAVAMLDIMPPSPPPDAPPPTIALGQRMDQVTAGFGQPLKAAKLGAKTIFNCKELEVTFTNGKVTNFEQRIRAARFGATGFALRG